MFCFFVFFIVVIDRDEPTFDRISVLEFGDSPQQTLTIIIVYGIGGGLFILFFLLSMCYLRNSTLKHTRALKSHPEEMFHDDLAMRDLSVLLYNTETATLVSMIGETIDILSDVWLAATLVTSNKDYDTKPREHNEDLFYIGISSLLFALFGIICFGVKTYLLQAIYVVLQYHTLWKAAYPDKPVPQTELVLGGDKTKAFVPATTGGAGGAGGKVFVYDKKHILRDVLMWDIFTGAMEDIPQTLIALTVMIVWDEVSASAIISVFTSVCLILWKIVRLCMNCNGCGTGETSSKSAMQDRIKKLNELEMAKQNGGLSPPNQRGASQGEGRYMNQQAPGAPYGKHAQIASASYTPNQWG